MSWNDAIQLPRTWGEHLIYRPISARQSYRRYKEFEQLAARVVGFVEALAALFGCLYDKYHEAEVARQYQG